MSNDEILEERVNSLDINTIKEFIILMNIIGIKIDEPTAIKIILATELFAKQTSDIRLSDCANIITESDKLINQFVLVDVQDSITRHDDISQTKKMVDENV